ncbi:Multidrug-efflux transporter MexB [Legionella massiliensis]|uniref:Multidrug-efflux transporter MexB n=1 Tax=Legionella massiliensis TaxID=1034943 RepID=A0A078KXB8_9GAMM|nr:efflux RND transporter permease subunit [Legionella massiliensis]CDZ77702.1 Multidrug-efflux transporter MexB [Legionella massiliensis]CEE13440.1 Multidrug resistance protein MexB [Legionella massiliensis]
MTKLNLSEYAVHHRPFMFLIMFFLLGMGFFAFMKLNRLEDPVFTLPAMTITVTWPGASAQEIQDSALDKIEQAVAELEQFDYTWSYSRQGYGVITVWLKEGYSNRVINDAWYQARKKVNDIRGSLPADLQSISFNDEFSDIYPVIYTLTSQSKDLAQLYQVAKDIKRDIQTIPQVNKIRLYGHPDEKVFVDIPSKKLAALGLNYGQIESSLQTYNQLKPMGQIQTGQDQLFLRLKDKATSVNDIQNITINKGSNFLRLGDFAKIYAGYEEPPSFLIRYKGQPAVALAITNRADSSVLDLGNNLSQRMVYWQKKLADSVQIHKTVNQPEIVSESMWEFERSFIEALAIVMMITFLWLGWRTGVVIAASVPLVLASMAIVMYYANWSLNRVTLGSLIIALGLLVDDAIISTESMMTKIAQGLDKTKAAVFAYSSTAFPMLTGTLVTAAGFIPVGFAHSATGEYAGGIFYVVGCSLVISWFVSVLFTPIIGMSLLDKKYLKHDPQQWPWFRRLINHSLESRYQVIVITSALFIASVLGIFLVKQQFFPPTPRLEVLIDIKLHEGASVEATEKEVHHIERYLDEQPGIRYYSAYIGAGALRFFISLPPVLPNPGYAQFVIMAKDLKSRDELYQNLQALFASSPTYTGIRARVTRLDFGPPVEYPIQFRVIGKDPETLKQLAYQVLNVVEKSPFVRDVQLNWNEQVRVEKLIINQDKAKEAALDNEQIARSLNTIFYGDSATTLRRGEELVDVVVRGGAQERKMSDSVHDTVLFNTQGKALPLSQIAKLDSTMEEPVLWRRNRELTINVVSDLMPGAEGPDAAAKIWPSLQPIIQALPDGYRVEMGGAKEENDRSQQALYAVVPAMIVVTVLILMLQLQSLSDLCMVLLSAPLGIIGIVPALLLLDKPFGFVALIGALSLSGMIMRNTVILVDLIRQNMRDNKSAWDSVVDAAVRRVRPIFLTAFAAAFAMVPLSRSLFWGPMAISIMGGLLASTALTLLFIPALYAAWHKIKREG